MAFEIDSTYFCRYVRMSVFHMCQPRGAAEERPHGLLLPIHAGAGPLLGVCSPTGVMESNPSNGLLSSLLDL